MTRHLIEFFPSMNHPLKKGKKYECDNKQRVFINITKTFCRVSFDVRFPCSKTPYLKFTNEDAIHNKLVSTSLVLLSEETFTHNEKVIKK